MQLTSRRLGLLFLIKFNLPIVALLVGLFAAPPATQAEPFVVLATYDGVINPVSAEYLHDALAWAEEGGAQALIVALNTPGGLDTSMRLIIKDITGANIPVVVYVSPSSGRAASAGVFITMAAHVAAMAPGTNIGAAHPVNTAGPMDTVMNEKQTNDAAAFIRTIAQKRNRNSEWAENAVRLSGSIAADDALRLGVIDLIASNTNNLLDSLDGRTVSLNSGTTTLHTKGATIENEQMSF